MINQQSREIPKIGCVQHDCDACVAAAIKPKFEYIHQEDIGSGVFDIIRLKDGVLLFSYQDKHGIFNIFPTMGDYTAYCEGNLSGCQRVCIDNEYIEEGEPGYEEGVDALDRYLDSL